jgi:hypothetical protein
MHLQSRPESSNRVLMGQRLGGAPRQSTVELSNGRTLVVEGQPILKINSRWHSVLSRSVSRRASRPALFPLFPATICGRGTRQAAENVSGFSAVPRVPRVPRRFKHRSRFAEGSAANELLGDSRPSRFLSVAWGSVWTRSGRARSHNAPGVFARKCESRRSLACLLPYSPYAVMSYRSGPARALST